MDLTELSLITGGTKALSIAKSKLPDAAQLKELMSEQITAELNAALPELATQNIAGFSRNAKQNPVALKSGPKWY